MIDPRSSPDALPRRPHTDFQGRAQIDAIPTPDRRSIELPGPAGEPAGTAASERETFLDEAAARRLAGRLRLDSQF